MLLKYRRTASLNLAALGWHTALAGSEFQSITVLGEKAIFIRIKTSLSLNKRIFMTKPQRSR